MKDFLKNLKENKKIQLYFVILVLAFIVCGPFLRFHLATDSYNMINTFVGSINASISDRPISDLFLAYTRVIDFDMMNHQQFYTSLSIFIMVGATILLYMICENLTQNKNKSIWITGISSFLIIFFFIRSPVFIFLFFQIEKK